MKWIKAIIKFIVDDFKEDAATLKRIQKEKRLLPKGRWKEIKDELKKEGFAKVVSTWVFIWLCLGLAFTMGWIVASAFYQDACNTFIYDTYIEPQETGEWHIVYGSSPNRENIHSSYPNYNISEIINTKIQ